ncbi:hypothetical protein KP509_05G054000 [Ceratopteris richardii]|uniref:Erythronate-4-phosphate dehydrogenase family protein n=1 Tax=Ceratopteris richardii TaxID=49495 RepID=A0A8T2ULM1_CERRI|nr:hypothetical protein KP509_05G054000 [Ceratopteris richardii]
MHRDDENWSSSQGIEFMASATLQSISKKEEPNLRSLGISIPPVASLDVRVFYVRISCSLLEDAPDTLTIKYGSRPAACELEINGNKVPFTDEPVLILRRDRIDVQSSEVTYVATDRLRTSGSLSFEVFHNQESLICGAVDKTQISLDGQGIDRIGAIGNLTRNHQTGWVMKCKCTISSASCSFLKRRRDPLNRTLFTPSMEVYIAGRYRGAPVVLSNTVELVLRRKSGRRNTLDAIPELEGMEISNEDSTSANIATQMEDFSFYQEMDYERTGIFNGYMQHAYMAEDEGEISWFNAGVRVGVGIGLGICVGAGIGVGLMMRAYQSTYRNLRRRFL